MTPEQLKAAAERANDVVLPRLKEAVKGETGLVAVAACVNVIRHAANCQTSKEGQRALIRMALEEMKFSLDQIDAPREVAVAVEEANGKTHH